MPFSIEIDDEVYQCENTFSISQQGGAVSSSTFDIKVGALQSVPRTLSSVVFYEDTTPIFGGILQTIESPEFASGYEVARYRLSVQSYEVVFNNRLASEAFSGKYTHEIVQTIFTNYIAPEGFTLGAISTSTQLYTDYNFQFTQVGQILQELADDIGASYYISPDKKFYFLTRDAFVQIDAPEHITGLRIEEETGDLRTVQIVTGASEETSNQTENQYWTAGQVAWPLGYNVSSIIGFTINGATAGYGKLGIDEEDTSKTFLYEKGSNVITLNALATVKPATGDNCVIVYKGYYDIIVTNTNDSLKAEIAGINGTSGMIERILTDETIKNFLDADQKATALLSQYNERDLTVSCNIPTMTDTELYQMWYINRPDLHIVGQFVITEREISSFGIDTVWCRLKLKSKNFFARYGTILVTQGKSVGKDTKIYKTSILTDSLTITDSITVLDAGIIFYPVSASEIYILTDPALDGFYPAVS